MHPLGHPLSPDPRVLVRLTQLLRRDGSPRAWAIAGRALAQAVLAARGRGTWPVEAEGLAEAMIGSLLPVRQATQDSADVALRTELAAGAAVLSLVRPKLWRPLDGALTVWMGGGLGEPQELERSTVLTMRALLALWLDDLADARACVEVLTERGDGSAAWALHDWVLARRQAHGPARETECFHHLRLLVIGAAHDTTALVITLATLVLWRRMELPRQRALAWLDELVRPETREQEVASTG